MTTSKRLGYAGSIKHQATSAQEQEKKRTVGLIRVSDPKQEKEGFGLDVQRSHILAAASAIGQEITEWFCDVCTGTTESREALDRVREGIRSGNIGTVWVFKMNRLARDLYNQEGYVREAQANGAEYKSALELFDNSSIIGTLMRQISGAFSQYERSIIVLRTSEGKKESVQKNGTYGGGFGFFGFRPAGTNAARGYGKLVEQPREVEAIHLIFRLRQEGLSTYKIANALNEQQFVTFTGKPFAHHNVSDILQREAFYRGERVIHNNLAPHVSKVAHNAVLAARAEGDELIVEAVPIGMRGSAFRKGTIPDTHSYEEVETTYRLWCEGRTLSQIARSLTENGFVTTTSRGVESKGIHPQRVKNTLQCRERLTKFFRCSGEHDSLVKLIEQAPPVAVNMKRSAACRAKSCRNHPLTAEEEEWVWQTARYRAEGWSLCRIAKQFADESGKPFFDARVGDMLHGRGRYAWSQYHREKATVLSN